MQGRLQLIGLAGAALAAVSMATPTQAQFGGILGSGLRAATQGESTSDGCSEGKSQSAGSRVAGGILGSLAGSALGSAGGVFDFVPISGLTDTLTAAIACQLDPEEQKQAGQATLDATRGAGEEGEVEVGASASWASQTRDDVSGTSTVVARNDDDRDGLQCITVSDVIIVSGEETRADKRMCRLPPAVRYALAA